MEESKKWYQSVTIRNSVIGLVVSVLSLVAAATGKAFDIVLIQDYINQGWALIPFIITAWTSSKAIIGRKNATTVIEKKDA